MTRQLIPFEDLHCKGWSNNSVVACHENRVITIGPNRQAAIFHSSVTVRKLLAEDRHNSSPGGFWALR